MNTSNYSAKLKKTLLYSKEEAERLCCNQINPEHLLLGLLREGDNNAIRILSQLGLNSQALKSAIEAHTAMPEANFTAQSNIIISKSTEAVLHTMYNESRRLKNSEPDTEHLLLAMLKSNDNLARTILEEQKIFYSSVDAAITNSLHTAAPQNAIPIDEEDEEEVEEEATLKQKKNNTSTTPALDKFGHDLTQAARNNSLDPIVGREAETERVIQVLSRRKKNNPILIGEPGVGKTAIVEGLALCIAQHKTPRQLWNKRVISLDMASVVAGTKYRGQFEERIKNIIKEIENTPDIILFIDEIHTIVGAGDTSGSLDAANILKPSLARGELQCIGATSLNEYRKSIEKDGALERRFQKILVEPTSAASTLEILRNIKSHYEKHHNVCYTDAALEACVRLAERYISDRSFPDKAIDVLDEVGAKLSLVCEPLPKEIKQLEADIDEANRKKIAASSEQNYEEAATQRDIAKKLSQELMAIEQEWCKKQKSQPKIIDEQQIAATIASMTGVPAQRIAQNEGQRLKQMRTQLLSQIIGQESAVNTVVKSIQRNRIGLKDPNKPIGTFLFLGPTGVGKTLLAKLLAQEMFDNRDALIRIDMSEYLEKFSVSRLIGAPPGYVGHEDGGQLTERVRRKPYSIILLDEIEKAHPEVFNLLLQVMDEGRLTDSLGRMVDFRNTIIIMTSNVGSRQIKEFGRGVGFASQSRNEQEAATATVQKALNKVFSPEFLNRIDEVVTFNTLGKEQIEQIIDIETDALAQRLAQLQLKLKLDAKAKAFVVEKGFDAQNGARPLKRALQKYVEDPITDYLLENVATNATLSFTHKKDAAQLHLSVKE